MFEELERYKSLDFFARQVVEGFITGLHRSPFHGFSVEFSEHRQYNSGESTRNIDWKLYGRTDKLFIKTFEEETNLRCQLIIDQSGSMFFPVEGQGDLKHPNKLTFSVYATAALTELLLRQRDAFGLTLFSDHIDLSTPTRSSRTHQQYIYSLLEPLLKPVNADDKRKSTASVAESLHLTAEQLHRRSMVIIFTDAFVSTEKERDELFDALRHLRHCKHEVLFFHTFELARELDFEFDNRPHIFIDLETGQRLKVQPAEVAETYRSEMHRQQSELKQRAIQYNIDYQPVDVGRGFDQILMPFLIKRQREK
ncbi:MAG: DUF58 domain-containing protein [Bacteroidales bacterium]|nr:DUF58 domain-containing protein [Bacteroidales bacterium]